MRGRAGVDRRLAFLGANPLCVACTKEGRTEPATEVDHITPLANGGPDVWANLQGLCKEHHRVKTQCEAIGWRA